MDNMYRVTGLVKKNCGKGTWAMDVTAPNMKDAKSIAERKWYDWQYDRPENRWMHLFHVTVSKIPEDKEFEYNFWHRM